MNHPDPDPAPAHPPEALPPIVVIGASFGGVEALMTLVAGLPAGFPAIVALVLHIGNQPSILPELLGRVARLRARHARDGETLLPGTVYVAPSDHHLLVEPLHVRLSRGPRENHARPAIDPLFRTAAIGWRSRCIGVVLTGHLDDGTAGLQAIKACGGIAVVQDPDGAAAPSMPASALQHVQVDHCVALDDMPALLARLVGVTRPGSPPPLPEPLLREQALFNGENPMDQIAAIGKPTLLTCPDCGGTLSELQDPQPLRYRCHTGHAYTAKSLASAQEDRTDASLQASLRALKEREMLLRRLAAVADSIGDHAQARAGQQQAERVHEQAMRLAALMQEETDSA
jgi:two-component system chemotaxis response regulator CheB